MSPVSYYGRRKAASRMRWGCRCRPIISTVVSLIRRPPTHTRSRLFASIPAIVIPPPIVSQETSVLASGPITTHNASLTSRPINRKATAWRIGAASAHLTASAAIRAPSATLHPIASANNLRYLPANARIQVDSRRLQLSSSPSNGNGPRDSSSSRTGWIIIYG